MKIVRSPRILAAFFALFLFFVTLSSCDLIIINSIRGNGGVSGKDKYEPNDSWQKATEIELDTVYSATIYDAGDEDYYRFTTENTSDSYDVVAVSFTNVAEDMRLALEIFDENGQSIDWEWSETRGANWTYERVFSGGTYIMKVAVAQDNSDAASTGAYSFKVYNSNANDDYEPDDTFEQARGVNAFPSGKITGKILVDAANDSSGDWEFFKVTLHAGKKVSWTVDPTASDMELHFYVYDSSKQEVGSLDGDDGQTLNYYVNYNGTADTYFYIKLGGYLGDSGNGEYTISFTETDAN